jgi:KUP system potassium uptake protein
LLSDNQISVQDGTLSENPATAAAEAERQAPQGKLQTLGLSALGIVFGDIGTSPLYTFKTILGTTEGSPDAGIALGALSLVLWTHFIITTVK